VDEIERNKRLTRGSSTRLYAARDCRLVELKEYMDTELVTEVICGGERRPEAEGIAS
jgi:hypothetical protein